MRKMKLTAILSIMTLGIGLAQLSSAHHSAVAFDKPGRRSLQVRSKNSSGVIRTLASRWM